MHESQMRKEAKWGTRAPRGKPKGRQLEIGEHEPLETEIVGNTSPETQGENLRSTSLSKDVGMWEARVP